MRTSLTGKSGVTQDSAGRQFDKILNVLQSVRPEKDFTRSTDFIADDLLDSFDMVALVSGLDKAFDIAIDGLDIVPENFRNLVTIGELLKRYEARRIV
jgi:acyl carrier protein